MIMIKKKIIIMIAGIGILGVFCNIRCPEARAASVRINETNFPDLYFRAYVEAEFDKNGDGKLDYGERAAVNLSLAALVIENRAEMEKLKSLQRLYFYQYQDVGIFDLSRMENVADFSLGSQSVQEVVLKNNKKLKKLYLGFTFTKNLKEVDLL